MVLNLFEIGEFFPLGANMTVCSWKRVANGVMLCGQPLLVIIVKLDTRWWNMLDSAPQHASGNQNCWLYPIDVLNEFDEKTNYIDSQVQGD